MKDYNKFKTEIIMNFYADEICKKLNVKKSEIFKKVRDRELTDIRAMVCYLTKLKFSKAKLQDIADFFCQRHSTVKHSIKKIKDLKPIDAKINKVVNHCESLDFEDAILLRNGIIERENGGVYEFRNDKVLVRFEKEHHFLYYYNKDNNGNFIKSYHIGNIDVIDVIILSQNSAPLTLIITLLKN